MAQIFFAISNYMKKTNVIQVRLTDEMKSQAMAAAEVLDTTLADLARQAWERAVKRAEKKAEGK